MIRHIRLHPRHNLPRSRLPCFNTRLQRDIRPRHLGRLRLLIHANDGGIRDLGVRQQLALELGRRDLEALVLDELLDAVGDVEVPVLVLVADVAGLEVAVGGEGVGGAGGVVQVAFEDVGALDPELARFADGQFFLFWGHVFGGLVGEEDADGADGGVPAFEGLAGVSRLELW